MSKEKEGPMRIEEGKERLCNVKPRPTNVGNL